MKLLKYSEALEQAQNKEWFKSFYKETEVLSDEKVDLVNELANSISNTALSDYFEQEKDLLLLNIYYDDLMDYLKDLKYNFLNLNK